MSDFKMFGLAERMQAAIAKAGYTTATPIQSKTIPLILEGRDIIGLAQTGTGKTLAFAAPLLDRLSRTSGPAPARGARILVLAPTRELAGQIAASFETYGAGLNLRVVMVCGGVKIGKQVRQLERGAHVLVATPGRLIDLMDQKAVSLSKVETLVLDEADQMLDLGFIHALRAIARNLPAERQTLLFSATMPKTVEALAGAFLRNPASVSVAPVSAPAGQIEHRVCFVEQSEKLALLAETIRDPALRSAIVFVRTKHGADGVVRRLANAHIDAIAIHGNKSQAQRERALDAFRQGRVPILVATDIAARGIHIDGLGHVINYDLPDVAEQFVHRIGRTARAGASGVAVSFVSKAERPALRAIEKLTGLRLAPNGETSGLEESRKPSRGRSQGQSRHPSRAQSQGDGQGKAQGHRKGRSSSSAPFSAPSSAPSGERRAQPAQGEHSGGKRQGREHSKGHGQPRGQSGGQSRGQSHGQNQGQRQEHGGESRRRSGKPGQRHRTPARADA